MLIQFTKMHGLGNDFVMIENMEGKIRLSPDQVRFLCDRHLGIGADGVILIESSPKADCFMNYYNADGFPAEMCGNGVRCVAKLLKDKILQKVIPQMIFKIDTRAVIKNVECLDDNTFSANMGKPIFDSVDFPDKSLELEGLSWNFVSMGNPHAVAFVKDVDAYDVSTIGPKIENNPNFPNRINVHLVEEINKKEFKIKIWERSCGITLASGTAACAVYAIARKYKNAETEVTMQLPGGILSLYENKEGEIIMRGPATTVFESTIEVKE